MSRNKESRTTTQVPKIPSTGSADLLAQARQLNEKEDHRGCITEINGALMKAASQRFHLPFTELNKANIKVELLAQGYAPLAVQELLELLIVCEENLFMPELSVTSTDQLLNKATRVIGWLNEKDNLAV